MKNLFLPLIFLFFLTSCKEKMLSVYTDYITIEDLASFYVNTPDPLLNRPPFGQQLITSWSLKNAFDTETEMYVVLRIRLRNREEITKKVKIRKRSGSYTFCLNREQYCNTGGILAYKVQLIQNGHILKEERHQLWVELITLDKNDEIVEDMKCDRKSLMDNASEFEEREVKIM